MHAGWERPHLNNVNRLGISSLLARKLDKLSRTEGWEKKGMVETTNIRGGLLYGDSSHSPHPVLPVREVHSWSQAARKPVRVQDSAHTPCGHLRTWSYSQPCASARRNPQEGDSVGICTVMQSHLLWFKPPVTRPLTPHRWHCLLLVGSSISSQTTEVPDLLTSLSTAQWQPCPPPLKLLLFDTSLNLSSMWAFWDILKHS